ncbi:PREDICTED: tigger transposable element-derived protein 4-like [Amphimedon queenslandica]|uniref:HTH CENPB-type domain-containing protein n=1 Tax=Amphimedon queenslandica TaxID=400682 RepID=A0A1X7TWC0_AMPQE|nr:PREDICTED: tigger transposable element-derived protein 4-like [Amphimedon queenslandica]|eukprot:XP_011406639.1 PREDICTED: tigger transposable element-derived protein 4-like [Amphimedon queenslandica]
MSTTKKRNDLSLQLKYEVIQRAEKEPKIGVRRLADIFSCGKTQISCILRDKERIKDLYESNSNGGLCQVRKRIRTSEYSDVNDSLYQWYQLAVKRNLYPDGSLLAEKARLIAAHLGHNDFKASNGWLHRWKSRHNIKQRTVSGESGEVNTLTEESWKERIPELVQGYKAEDICNIDETGCFWRALPDKGLAQAKKDCKGGEEKQE